MKNFSSLLIALCISCSLQAQPVDKHGAYSYDDIENITMGWMDPLSFKDAAKPLKQNGRNYPVQQIEDGRKIGSWLQQTYTPTGLLGEIKLSVLAPPPSYPETSKEYNYNEAEKNNRNALPNTYGAWSKFHKCVMKTATRKFWPLNGNHCYTTLHIMANNVELITTQLVYLSSPDAYYCTMPKYTVGQKGRFDKEWLPAYTTFRNFSGSPNLQAYEHYLNPVNLTYTVIMTKDGKPIPFEKITIGEFINRIEEQFPMMYKITVNNGVKLDNLLDKAKKGFQVLKNQFKSRLNEYAYLSDANKNIDLLDFVSMEEGKEINWLKTTPSTTDKHNWTETNYPILRLKNGVKEACANGQPQWVVFRLEELLDKAYGGSVQLMDNFVSRFNYAYVYKYFFGKDKVIEPYTVLNFANAEQKGASKAPAVLSAAAQQKAADKQIIFFEDFSSVAADAIPPTWNTERSQVSGERTSVVQLDDAEGKWLKLKRNASPKNLPAVTGDFEISYDVLVHKGDVPWGTPGIDMDLTFTSGGENKKYGMNVTPGDMNRKDAAGWVTLILGGAVSCKMSSYYSIPDFTGSKPVNKVTLSFRKKGESVAIYCNNNKVYDCATAFAPGATLKNMNFYVNDKNVYYISNIQLKKL